MMKINKLGRTLPYPQRDDERSQNKRDMFYSPLRAP